MIRSHLPNRDEVGSDGAGCCAKELDMRHAPRWLIPCTSACFMYNPSFRAACPITVAIEDTLSAYAGKYNVFFMALPCFVSYVLKFEYILCGE